jgi:uncharacterized OB-fold protein
MQLNDREEALRGEHFLQYPYRRATGPILGRFFTELRDNGKILGVKTSSGEVICPPVDADPDSHADLSASDMVEVGPGGTVASWTWLNEPLAKNPLQQPFAWALIKLDGADSALLHAVDAGSESAMQTGMRVVPKFAEERTGGIRDITCFVP